MGCFQIDLNSPLELLFYGLSLLQAIRAVQLAGAIRKDWSGFRQPPLTLPKMRLVEQGAYLLAIPPSVIVHEYFHAIPIWLFGGRVVSCGYGFYWGFVEQDRLFLASQEWFIKLAGTLGSLVFTAVLFFLLYRNQSQTLRYFARQSLKTLSYYTLIYYPIFSAVTFIGDWRVIYDFGSTPLLSGGTAVVHLALLLLFWQANQRGWFEMVGHQNQSEAAAFKQLAADWQQNPQNSTIALNYADALRRGGAPQQAKNILSQIIAQNPNLAEAYFQLALIQSSGRRTFPKTAVANLEKSLQLGLETPRHQAIAHQFLSQYFLDTGKGQLALQHLDTALAAVSKVNETSGSSLHKAQLLHMRSLAHQRQQQPERARQDAEQALSLAQSVGDAKAISFYQRELEVLFGRNGRV
ncbi:MAG: tetratricopeptide repeat protein [Anaerolineales bacterium]|nr:tetratricopeptide repeat protein [Anaerolineales bacterium]MCB8939203.1 tetratricopeptide repeat protein [Ardenticatenaceae bacterium]